MKKSTKKTAARKVATPTAPEKVKATAAPSREVSKKLSDEQRALIDPQVRRVNAIRQQAQEAGKQVDMMLALMHPEFERGDLYYDPSTGEFFRPLKREQPAQDVTTQPFKGLSTVKGNGRKAG